MDMFDFCTECMENADYKLAERLKETEVKGTKVRYKAQVAVCEKCGEEMYIPKLHDNNLEELYREYRSKEGIITEDAINEILEKYNIDKKPLARLLGWGEMTIIRYTKGYIPTKEYSDKLKKILDDPSYYEEVLEKNKSNFSSELSYRKTRKKLDELLTPALNSKIECIAEYIVCSCNDITNLALQKLLYYVDLFSPLLNNGEIFTDKGQAWVHGPVYKDIYYKYKAYKWGKIECMIPDVKLESEEKLLVDSVIKHFGCYSGKILMEFTHREDPWIKARKGVKDNERSNKEITKKDMKKYLDKIRDEYSVKSVRDIEVYSRAMFEKVYS